jgi:hypothetical protein
MPYTIQISYIRHMVAKSHLYHAKTIYRDVTKLILVIDFFDHQKCASVQRVHVSNNIKRRAGVEICVLRDSWELKFHSGYMRDSLYRLWSSVRKCEFCNCQKCASVQRVNISNNIKRRAGSEICVYRDIWESILATSCMDDTSYRLKLVMIGRDFCTGRNCALSQFHFLC